MNHIDEKTSDSLKDIKDIQLREIYREVVKGDPKGVKRDMYEEVKKILGYEGKVGGHLI
jgi:hypothetical protein